jgi:peroxiredoxin family protein
MNEEKNKLTMIVLSGDMDKVMAGYNIATGAAAQGMEVVIFYTFWGLKAIQKGNLTGRGLFGRMLGLMNRGGINTIGPSRLNFGGMGRWMFKKMMKSKGITPLSELQKLSFELGVRHLACQMSMDVMEIAREDLLDEVSDVVGVATMLEHASQSKVTLFI